MHLELEEIEASIRALPQSESIALGDISGIRYCALPARDRDRAEPIIIDGEVAVPGMEPYDMGQHLPAAVAFLQEQVAAGRRVLIHCLRGENRAGAVAAAFLVAEAALPADAVHKVQEARGNFALSNRAFVEQVHSFATERSRSRSELRRRADVSETNGVVVAPLPAKRLPTRRHVTAGFNFLQAVQKEPMSSGGLAMKFPMWLIPGSVLARLEHPLLPHETLLQQGKLVRWEPGHPRKVVFISHEWLGTYHPDPDFKQFKVLQLALENLRKGLARVRKDTVSELLRIPLPMPSDAEQRNCLDWDFWYDYISCPQLSVVSDMEVTMEEMSASKGELADAIASIPAYCDKADYTIVLVVEVGAVQSALPRSSLQGRFTVEEDRKVLQELTGEAEFLNEDLDHFLDRYSLLDARSAVEGMTPLLPEAHIDGTVLTALSLAASLSSKEAVLALLDARASLDLPSGISGAGVVVQAAYFGNASVLGTLIERRGDMNHPTNLGGNALLAAAGASNVDCTRILLEQRADPNFMNYIGSTALSFSCLFNTDAGHAELLLQARADPNLRGLAKNCLWATVCWACQKTIQMGSATSIHWNIALSNGGTPLHVAALNGNLQVAMLLMEHDAHVEATWGDTLLTPLDLAQNHDHQDLVACLETEQRLRRDVHVYETQRV
ncbi:AKT1 [Symbiodinium necroappetens]|uniref:AKT1 protein n=1 Tax=Symbiodinium necroappetens TaxID=1628268 RepID=A0A812P166_9DINO|nr:AKT1 [Symbiodinium necroappetens]